MGDTDGSGTVSGITYPAAASTATEGSIRRGILQGYSYTELSEDENRDYMTEPWDGIFYSLNPKT